MPANLIFLSLLLTQAAPIAELPFELVGGRVYVTAEVGGRSVPVFVDSGAGVTLIDTGLAKEISAKSGGEVPVGGTAEKPEKGLLLQDTFIDLAGGKAKSNAFLALDLAPLAPFEGRRIQGILGSDLFNRYVVQIDYPASKVRLFDPKAYAHAGKASPVPIRIVGMMPQIDATLDVPTLGETPVVAMVDTGAGGAVTLTAKFAEAHDLQNKLPKGPEVPLAGVGGLSRGRLLRLNGLKIDGHSLKRPTSLLPLSEGGILGTTTPYDCLIGAEVLRRFVVTFDYSQQRMWFEPATDLAAPFVSDQTGLLLMAQGPTLGEFSVFGTVAGSPAVEAGLQPGDVLTHVDGQSLAGSTLDQLRIRFRNGTKPWKITVRRGTQTLEVTVKPRPLI
jgi:hypothetical protein